MDGRRRRETLERFDLAIGMLGFFAVAFTAVTLASEIQGKPALGWALMTLLLAVGTWVVWRWRRAALARLDAGPAGD